MSIIAFIIVGLVAGLLARALLPGKQSTGLVGTTLLGMVGAVVGGVIGTLVADRTEHGFARLDPASLALSVMGAVLVLFLYGIATGKNRKVTI